MKKILTRLRESEAGYWLTVLLACAIVAGIAIVILSGCQPSGKRNVYLEDAKERINKEQIDSLAVSLQRIEAHQKAFDSSLLRNAASQATIINNYKNVYEDIENAGTADSAQWSMLYSLLARHRAVAFERN